jgi:hypothetical protein
LHRNRQIIDPIAYSANKVRVLRLSGQFVAFRLAGEFDADDVKLSRHFADRTIHSGRTEAIDLSASVPQNFLTR